MAQKNISPSPKKIWAYLYEIVPPQAKGRLRTIKTLLDDENSNARGARTWAGRFVVEQQVTHILVVSDSPDQDRDVNHRLEVELKKLEAGFSITKPVAVVDDATPPPATKPPVGAGP